MGVSDNGIESGDEIEILLLNLSYSAAEHGYNGN